MTVYLPLDQMNPWMCPPDSKKPTTSPRALMPVGVVDAPGAGSSGTMSEAAAAAARHIKMSSV
jgi:hypothetical protein